MSTQLSAGLKVSAKTMGRNSKVIEGVIKDIVGSARGAWAVIVDAAGKEHKTRPGLVTPA